MKLLKGVIMNKVFYLVTLVLAISCGTFDDEMVEFTVEGTQPTTTETTYKPKQVDCYQPYTDPYEACRDKSVRAQKCRFNFIALLWEREKETVQSNISFFEECVERDRKYYQCVIEEISENNMREDCHEDF